MSDLADFLQARYAETREREQGKRKVIPSVFDGHSVEWRYEMDEPETLYIDRHPYPVEKYTEIATAPAPDPDVLADLDAKLAIVGRHAACGTGNGYCDDGGHGWDDLDSGGCADLARTFAGHPEFQAAWASDTPR